MPPRERHEGVGALDDAEIERAISTLAREPDGGLIAMPDSFNMVHRRTIIALADRYRLPAIYYFRLFATDGGLISYGPDEIDHIQMLGKSHGEMLRGGTPSPLRAPVRAREKNADLPPLVLAGRLECKPR
jgi:putative ABC transport system substrate-binding protein